MSELKPCPFCGSEVQDNERGEKYPKKSPMGGWIIHCECCGATLSQFRKSGKDEISWNTRPIEDELTARIAELEAVVDKLIWSVEGRVEFMYSKHQREFEDIVAEYKEREE